MGYGVFKPVVDVRVKYGLLIATWLVVKLNIDCDQIATTFILTIINDIDVFIKYVEITLLLGELQDPTAMNYVWLPLRTGSKDLKSSQEYPRNFGHCVAKHHLEYMHSDTWSTLGGVGWVSI